MQTIVGSNGQIGQELAKELYRNYTHNLRLVSRHPQPVNDSDELVAADLLDLTATKNAVAGSDIVYFTAGLPMDSNLWQQQFITMLTNVMSACRLSKSKLVFFDNTYMYPKTNQLQVENSPFEPRGVKSTVLKWQKYC
ncbi:hypothetical protein R078131_00317 [Convivina intestini]|nr:hypothetical protein R078131_00317 [Convivina intestini]